MIVREVLFKEQAKYDAAVFHPLQTWAWGEFKKKTGVDVVRLALFEGQQIKQGYQVTLHTVPKLGWKIGYFAKGTFPDEAQMFALQTIAAKYNLVFIKIEPDVYAPHGSNSPELKAARDFLKSNSCESGRPMFTPNSFILDISPAEQDLLASFKSKTRYNIRLAAKKGVKIYQDDSDQAFEAYIDLWKQTTKRQQFYAHDEDYQRNMWQTMRQAGLAHLVRAEYQGENLGTWIIFIHNNTLYYPYGASSRKHREVMANNLLAWEAIRFGKTQGCTKFDMWGSLGPDPDPKDPWYGFHRFKEGYSGTLMEFVGSYDYVADPQKYIIYKHLDKLRWKFLRLRSKLPF